MNNNLMNNAIKLALKSLKLNEVPVGCVIVDEEEKIIGFGYNSSIENNDPTAHAEIMAIRMACKKKKTHKLTGCSLYVTLQPCKMCEAAIYISGIKKVYFGAYSQSLENFEFKKKKFHKGLDGHLYYGGINEKKCEQLLKKFFKQIR